MPSQEGAHGRPAMSRRLVLGAGAAGIAGAVAGVTASKALTPATAAVDPATASNPAPAGLPEPIVVYVRDLKSGYVDVLWGTSQARVKDPALVARIARAL